MTSTGLNLSSGYGCGRGPLRRLQGAGGEAFLRLCLRSLSDGASVAVLGFVGLQKPRLRVIRTQHHIEAFVEHLNGRIVVSASTREWAIKKHLYRTTNVVACESIGRVLAERCIRAGINFVVCQPTPWEAASDSIKQLQSAMTEGGVVLQEPRRIYQ
ncbi:39S ribosomal protein L18, mitochondrial isoform X2 [Elephas maximus indicus]|uniref:39S ribosomal protein L18, mitochondrial isoform X2 n=1 Tax=Elephas maximus indicus TaxID=99487 RepID=UPI0021171A77|nr:39S ribosomal protein L18, mitochondrial isoform X2 [Elephas maximus indicus]